MTTAAQAHDPAGNDHRHAGVLSLVDNRCPTCDQPIAADELEHVRSRLAEQERQSEAATEALLEAARTAAEADAMARVAATEEQAAKQITLIEESHAADVLKARDEATIAANVATAQQLADVITKQKATEDELDALKTSQEATIEARVAEQRQVLDEEHLKVLSAANSANFEENQRLLEKLGELERRLQHKTSNEWGEGAEIDLFEALRVEFPDDKIERVKKGTAGADIVHTVIENGVKCGGIVYDSKNRKAWRNDFVEKLRTDQIAAKADHAILTTYKFPAGVRQLHIQDGVILTNPARAVVLAALLRKQIVQLYFQRLSNDERAEKMASLYDYVTSDRFGQRLEQMESYTQDLLEIDVKEKESHDRTWKKRGAVIRSAQRAQGDIESEVHRIIFDTGTSHTEEGE